MSTPTTNHKEIRRWAEYRDATPVEVSPYAFDGEPAILRLVFGGLPPNQTELRAISWESFFAQFELLGLVFVGEEGRDYQLLNADDNTRERYEGKVVSTVRSPVS